MYIPKINQVTDKTEILKFMQNHSFATIITVTNNQPTATHLPFTISQKDDTIILSSHFSRANKQWTDIENYINLVIFTGPHAYISPSNYTSELNVPTWNYIAVHAYGYGKLVAEPEQVMRTLNNMVDNYESNYRKQWDKLPEDYKSKMAKGIVAFEIKITELQAKKKISQNRNKEEIQNIIDTLSASSHTHEQSLVEYMTNKQPNS